MPDGELAGGAAGVDEACEGAGLLGAGLALGGAASS